MILLKRNYITALLYAFLVLCAVTSCIDDSMGDDMSGSASNGTPHYLAIKLNFGSNFSTRAAEDFDKGTPDDHLMGSSGNIAILFKGDNLYGVYDLERRNSENIKEGDYEEAQYLYVKEIPADKEIDFPNSCLVVLNGSKAMCDELKKNEVGTGADKILKEIWKDADPKNIGYADTDHKYFTMTNSMYYKDNKLQAPTEFNAEEHIKESYAEAKANPITVYVERMVAKFSFHLPSNGNRVFQPSQNADMIVFNGFYDDGSPRYQAKKWRIEVTGWNANALEKDNYIFKNLKNSEYFTGWNDLGNYRSYWSEDPHYDNDNYPWQYRRAIDYSLTSYGDLEDQDRMLRNFSFKDLGLGRPETDNSDINITKLYNEKIVYTPENTYDADAVAGKHDSRDELLAGTHLLVGAELQIQKGEDENDGFYTPEHLFRDRNGFWYLSERECIASLVHDFNQLLKSQSKMEFTHYGFWTDANESDSEQIVEIKGDFSLYYKNNNNEWKPLTASEILYGEYFNDEEQLKMAVATIRKGDGKRLPWIADLLENSRLAIGNNSNDPNLRVYDVKTDDYGTKIAGEYKGDTKGNPNYIKSLLYEWLGAIEHFNQGKMYYAVPIKNAAKAGQGNSTEETAIYGVVRNNWYQFTLENVKAIGIPVDDLDQPIVPERLGLNDQINFTINIIPWHYVDAVVNFQ